MPRAKEAQQSGKPPVGYAKIHELASLMRSGEVGQDNINSQTELQTDGTSEPFYHLFDCI